MTSILQLNNLTKIFAGNVTAVNDISMAVEDGEFITMLGPSGCGKTTMLRMIGGFEYPDSGSVILDGRDITDTPPYERPVNMMFQDFALFPHMSVAGNIGYGLRISGVKGSNIGREVGEMLELIDLPGMDNRLPSELSNGQRQRVALARALIKKPRILLLDEPLSALDAKLRQSMQVELLGLHRKIGITFIMVTHDQTEAMVMSERIMVMRDGMIEQLGTPTELYDQPETPYVADFLGQANMVPAILTRSESGRLHASIGDLQIDVTDASMVGEVGERMTLCIRPEKVRLINPTGDDRSGLETFEGVVQQVLYSGHTIYLGLLIGGDTSIMLHHPLDTTLESAAIPAKGERVICGVPADTITVFGR